MVLTKNMGGCKIPLLEAEGNDTVTFLLTDERGTLDRVMLRFSDRLKETARLADKNYEVRLRYEAQDEAEIAIRVLSFGPMLKVTAPDRFIAQVKHRLAMQRMSKKQISDF